VTFVAVILTDTTDDTRVSEMSTRWKQKTATGQHSETVQPSFHTK